MFPIKYRWTRPMNSSGSSSSACRSMTTAIRVLAGPDPYLVEVCVLDRLPHGTSFDVSRCEAGGDEVAVGDVQRPVRRLDDRRIVILTNPAIAIRSVPFNVVVVYLAAHSLPCRVIAAAVERSRACQTVPLNILASRPVGSNCCSAGSLAKRCVKVHVDNHRFSRI